MARKRKAPLPSPESGGEDSGSDDSLGPKFDKHGKPIQRNAANARERARMRVLSKAFSRLKTTLPWVPADTKLSKLDTLRLASCYIAHLRQILDEDKAAELEPSPRTPTKPSKEAAGQIHPMNLTWPFTFNGKITATPGDMIHPKIEGASDMMRLPTKLAGSSSCS
jgi:musculin (activated B-cell factor-1)